MRTFLLQREQWVPKPLDEVFAFFSKPQNLQELTPDWLDFRIVEAPQTLSRGSLIRYQLRWHWIPISWTSEISEWDPPHSFVDRAIDGPYALWDHRHSFEAHNGGTTIRDRVTYALPFGWIGVIAQQFRVRHDLDRIFDYRTSKMRQLFPE